MSENKREPIVGSKTEGGYVAPIHSPNEFHLGPNGELLAGLGVTAHPARVTPVSPEDLAAMADREAAIANAEDMIEAKKLAALAEVSAASEQLARERAEFEAEKAAAAKKSAK